MSIFNEHSLEMAIMELFEQQGYSYVNGETIHKELSEVLLRDDLRMYLMDRYSKEGITPLEVERVLAKLTADNGAPFYLQNAQTYRLMTEGFAIKREDASKPDLFVEVIDFENVDRNIFKVVNQLEIKGTQKRIPDGIVYVNGLPVVVLEFKSAVKTDATIMNAYTQLTVRYRRDIPELFRYNAFVVISDGVNNKYGALFADYDFFYAWRKIERTDKPGDGIDTLHTMMEGLFRKERLLSVIKDFVFFPDNSKNELKIVCRYPQFFATHRLYENILEHSHINVLGDGKGGTYFGATGCGKSLTMLFLTRMLMRSRHLASPTIVLITDRTDLDDQLSAQFLNAKQFIGDETVINVETRRELGELLRGRKSGGVFLTTIQKFSEDTDLLSERANIICISDEAHRSQANVEQNVRITDAGVKRSYGFAKYLHDSLPNATYVGFTGTPIDATIDVFGDVVDSYSMTESVVDGITRRIVYEGRAAKVFADSKQLQEIENYYKKCEEEGANEYQIEESKKAVTQMNQIIGDPQRLAAVAKDFVEHYEKRIEEGSTVCGKAMFVCSSRPIAYDLYKQIIALRPNWAEDRIKMVMTRTKDDEEELYNLLGSDEDRKKLDVKFKDPESDFKIAIVVDMWITGFDAPCLDTMYIDKPLQKHTLIQTISRVNRVFEGKDKGLVVDYLGIKNNMNNALKQYAGGGDLGENIETIEKSLTMVKDELDLLRRMFATFDYSKFTTGSPLEQLMCLKQAAEFIQSTEKSQNLFMGHVKKLKSAFNLCSNHEEITDKDREDIHFFTGVRSIIFKLTKGTAPDITQMNRKVSQMLQKALQSDGVEEVAQVNVNTKDIDLLSEDYMARLEKLNMPNTKVKLMEKLLRTVITEFKKVNKMKGVDFTKRLNELVTKYNDRSDNAVFAQEVLDEVAKQMAELLKEVNKEKKSFKDLGITYEEKAFYDILKEIAHKFGFEYPEDKLLKLSSAVKAMVDDKSKYTDWANRTDIKAELQMDLILILAEHGYPPVPQDDVFKEIFEQAENFKKYEKADESEPDAQTEGIADTYAMIDAITSEKLLNVEDDHDVRNCIFDLLHMDKNISDLSIQRVVIERFGERYPYMELNDWRHIIEDYTSAVRDAVNPKAKEITMDYLKAAETLDAPEELMMLDASAYEIVMIVHELHQRGYEQLRLFPGISPNGMCWRWMIYPKVLMKDNSFEHHGDCTPFECLRGSTSAAFPEEGQELKTADDFIRGNERFLDMAKGEDKAYVEWFEQIVEHAKNKDFPIAFEEFFDAEEWKFTSKEPLAYPPFTPVLKERQ